MGVASLDLQQTDAGQGKVDYGSIINKPMINGVTLEGNLSTEDINIFIPQLVSELQNDAGYITKNVSDLANYYDKTEVNNMVSAIPKFDIKVVDTLPTEDISSTTIYLLMVEGKDRFEEYIYVNGEWDKLGDGNIDLSDYATYEYVDAELAKKVDAASLATVALSGRYSDLIGTPVNLSQFTNDVGYLTSVPDGSVSRDKLSSALNSDLTAVENAVEGLQNSVRGLSDTKADKTTVSALADTIALKADRSEIPTKTSDLTNDSGFITEADVPTKVSELTNDSGYITSAALTPYSTTQQMNTAISTAVANKADRSEIPTKVSDLTNDSGFVNSTQVNAALAAYTYPSQDLYTQSDIDEMLAQISSLKIEVVDALPSTGNANTIYLLKVRQQGNDIYQEYFWVNDAWELIGGIDLTDYYTKTEVNALLTAKADVSAIPTKTSDLTNDSNFVVDANYVHTDNNYTTAEKNKLAGIAAGAEVNVQSDWTQADSSADDFIKNKPSIPAKTSDLTNDSGFITSAAIPTNVSAFNNDAGYLDEIPDDSVGLNQLDSTIVNALNNINNKANTADLATVAFSGDYDDLINGPTIPTKTSELTNDSNFVSNTSYATASTGGVIKVGGGLVITNGVLSATGGGTADSVEWANVLNRPSDVSYWTNDAGYITSADLPTKTSELTNDSGFITSADVPTKTSDLTNDSDFVEDASYVHTDNNYTTAEKNKLAGISAGAEVNQNAFSNIKVGATTVAADGKTDTLELVAGSNVTLTPDDTNDKVTIAATNTTYNDVTTTTHGLMTAADKVKLNGIATGAEVNVQSDWNVTDASSDAFIKNKPTIPAAITVDSALSSSSTNPVQNKVITNALGTKQGALNTAQLAATNSGITAAKVSTYDNYASQISEKANSADLATVATTGAYSDLTGTPTTPTEVSQLENDAGYQTAEQVSQSINSAISSIDVGVTSFNGEKGAVTYEAPVTSVNGKTGAVQINVPVVDDALSTTSTNAIANNVVTTALNTKVQATDVSSVPIGTDAFTAAVKQAAAEQGYVTLQLTTTDPGEGSALPANTLLGVY